jgi:hypothetical protein
LEAFADVVNQHDGRLGEGLWGWKNPHAYLFLGFLAERLPGMRFVHLIRDGRDMALSPNQNQPTLYGPTLLSDCDLPPGPQRSALFWSEANCWALELGTSILGHRYLTIRFEDLIDHPEKTVEEIALFVGATPNQQQMDTAAATVVPPATRARYLELSPDRQLALAAACSPGLGTFGYDTGSSLP